MPGGSQPVLGAGIARNASDRNELAPTLEAIAAGHPNSRLDELVP